ncbi:TPA: hypothetical protein HA246_04930 [Candidatus Woesearchaeota archaeon]|nr:hypothetical protein [Candidatus Woesearchaeota archaeon]
MGYDDRLNDIRNRNDSDCKNTASKIFDNKKAQLTAILLIAFVILATASVYFMLRGFRVEKLESEIEFISSVSGEAKPIALFVGECIKGSSVPALKLLGLQGGSISDSGKKVDSEYGKLTYGFNGKNTLATLEQMRQEIAIYMNSAIENCADFTRFEQQGYAIEKSAVNTQVELSKDKITFNVEYPLKIAKGSFTQDIKDFRQEVKVGLYDIVGYANAVIEKIAKDPYHIDFTFLATLPYNISVIPLGENNFAYFIVDEKLRLENQAYKFVFAAKHLENKAPRFNVNASYMLVEEQKFFLKLEASDPENDELSFKDDTAMFDITSENIGGNYYGVIDVTPQIPGMYNVTITLEDSFGNDFRRKVKFVVKEKAGTQ